MTVTALRRALPLVLGAISALTSPLFGADDKTLPASLSTEQRENLSKFLKSYETPDRYVPKAAKIVDIAPRPADADIVGTPDKPIKQFTVQITPHRSVPSAEIVDKADVYFYRPHPVKGRQGLTVKYTVDLKTGEAVGSPEVLTRAHTAVTREEVAEAVALVKDKFPAVQALYKDRAATEVRWEYLQMKINRKSADYEAGDRVIRFVFMANALEGRPAPPPVSVIVNLTKDLVIPSDR